jgi:hypothetical protein
VRGDAPPGTVLRAARRRDPARDARRRGLDHAPARGGDEPRIKLPATEASARLAGVPRPARRRRRRRRTDLARDPYESHGRRLLLFEFHNGADVDRPVRCARRAACRAQAGRRARVVLAGGADFCANGSISTPSRLVRPADESWRNIRR